MDKIPVYQPYLGGNEKLYVSECLDSNWISSRGSFVEKFEKLFADYVQISHASTVSNGTVALHVALEALGIKAGDEVIVPTFTYVASVNTILQTGAKPVFVDSLQETLQIDPEAIKRKITNRTRAVMAVHLYGYPCDMERITEICKSNNLLLIEDCAEALGSKIGDRHVGTYGDIATFSFFGNKTLTTGEGGMVISNDIELIEKVNLLKSQAVSPEKEYWHSELGFNYRMTNICAAIGVAQLENLDEILRRKREIAEFYQTNLIELPLRHHKGVPNLTHSYWMNSIILDEPEHRDSLRTYLSEKGIETRPFFYPATSFAHCYIDEVFPVAESMSKRGINLPSFPSISNEELERIHMMIRAYFGG